MNFVLATTPAEDRLNEARTLVARTEREKLNLRGIVLNRMLDERTFNALLRAPRRIPGHLADAARLRTALRTDATSDPRLVALVGYLEEYGEQQRREVERAAQFAHELPPHMSLGLAPAVELGVRDLRSLAKLGSILARQLPGRKFLDNAAGAFGIALSNEGARQRRRAP
jgi:hypothetical protein